MRRYQLPIFIVLILIPLLTACKTGDYITPEETAKMQSEAILNSVKKRDAEAIKAMFCQQTKERHPDLDREIEDFFAFIKGEIISYDEPDGSIGGGNTRDGRVVKQSLRGRIHNIKTDQGKTYDIGFKSYSVYDEDESYVGMSVIGIVDVDSYDKESGYGSMDQIGDEL